MPATSFCSPLRQRPLLHNLLSGKDHLIAMVPGVAGLIMGRGGQVTVLIALMPIGLPFEILSMATRALLSVKN